MNVNIIFKDLYIYFLAFHIILSCKKHKNIFILSVSGG